MLQNAYFLAKIGADTAENEQHFAEILPIGRCAARSTGGRGRTARGRAISATGAATCSYRRAAARGSSKEANEIMK